MPEPRSLVAVTVKAVSAIALLSVMATHWLASNVDRAGLGRLAADATADPVTTGALADRAAATRLDPCTALRR